MYLLLIITISTCLLAFAHQIVKPIKPYLTRPSAKEREKIATIEKIKRALLQISIRENYTDYIKMERQLSAAEIELAEIQNKNTTKHLIINYCLGYGAQILISIVLICISLYYRYVPVVIFDEKFNFAPFSRIIGFPTNVSGAISVPFWIFVSNFTFRSLAYYIK